MAPALLVKEASADMKMHCPDEADVGSNNTTRVPIVSPASPASPWNPLREVDSALLSALCDARERKALLRLERVLVEFAKDASTPCIEVGGAYNSIVLGNGEGVDPLTLSAQSVQEISSQQQRGLRQTSFQRLILHRLADRFGIAREVIPPCGDNVVTALNFIRLIKTEQSAVPLHLLIDVDLSLLVDYKNPLARGGAGGGTNEQDENVRLLADAMGSSALDTNAGAASLNSKKNKKMVIMKRNSTGCSGADDKAKGKREGKARLKGKKLVDKEKAYEEARARIFGVAETDATPTVNDAGGGGGGGGTNYDESEKTLQLDPQVPEFSPQNYTLGDSHHSISSVASDTVQVSGESKTVEQKQNELKPTLPGSQKEFASSEEEVGNPKQGSTTAYTSTPPSASTTKSTGKAVYRNRQQEEADPDFRRRSDIRPTYMTMPMCNGVVPPYATNNPYAPNNPYVNMVNMAMGQHPHTMAMPGQQQHNHYYGQHPTSNAQGYIYPNHLASPQSPTYFVSPQGGYHAIPNPNQQVPSALQNNAPDAGGGGSSKPNDSSSSTSLEKSQPQTYPKRDDSSLPTKNDNSNGGANTEVARSKGCASQRVEPALKPEDFPALR